MKTNSRILATVAAIFVLSSQLIAQPVGQHDLSTVDDTLGIAADNPVNYWFGLGGLALAPGSYEGKQLRSAGKFDL